MSEVKPFTLFKNLEKQSLFASLGTPQVNFSNLCESPLMKKQESQSGLTQNDSQIMPDNRNSLPDECLLEMFNSPPLPSTTVKKKVTFDPSCVPSLNEESKHLNDEVDNHLNTLDSLPTTITSNDEFPINSGLNLNCAKLGELVANSLSEPKLQNIHSTADLKCKLDLDLIALNARNTEYDSKRFPAVIMKNTNPKATALVFSSGKVL